MSGDVNALPQGRRLHWLELGHGEPCVVLEAGFGDTALDWAAVIPALARETRVIAYDRAGLGTSDPDPELPTVERRLADLAALLEDAGASPAVLVGHSWGGILAWALACTRPELVAGLVLVDPADLDMLDALPGWVRGLFTGVFDNLLMALRPPGVQQEHLGIVASEPAIRGLQATASLPEVPVVVISAERGFPRRVRRHWTTLQERLAASARGRHLVATGSGHAIPRLRPDLVAGSILEVVRDLRG